MMHGDMMIDGVAGMSAGMWIYMLLLWGFAILGLVVVVKWIVRSGQSKSHHR